MLAIDVILEQRVHPGPMTAVGTRIERLDLTEVVHVLLQASPVAVTLVALETAEIQFAVLPDLGWQCAAVEFYWNSEIEEDRVSLGLVGDGGRSKNDIWISVYGRLLYKLGQNIYKVNTQVLFYGLGKRLSLFSNAWTSRFLTFFLLRGVLELVSLRRLNSFSHV